MALGPWLAALVATGFVVYGVPHLIRRTQQARLRSRVRAQRALVLSYDDGPSENLTPTLLETLRQEHARATFFVLGARARAMPQVLLKMQEAGHEIGSHSGRHLNAWKIMPHRAVADLREGFRAVAPWLSHPPIFRPPYGKLSLFTWLTVVLSGWRIGWWTHVSGDTQSELPLVEEVIQRVISDGGGVVLMHDFERVSERADFVLALTRALLRVARKEKLNVVTLGQVLDRGTARR